MSLIHRLILAFALMAGIAPALAQVPPPVPALPDTERRTTYSISASTCACNVNFALYGDGTDYANWVEVWLNGVMQSGNWTITSPTGSLANIARPITDAVLTFTSVQTGTVQIVGARRPRRISQFASGASPSGRDFNQALTDIVAQNRETWDKINDVTGRVPRTPPGETLSIWPPASSRANMSAIFDSGGNLVPGVSVPASTFVAGKGITLSGVGPTTIAGLYGTNPGNLYVATTGSDGNTCLLVGSPCLTIARAVQVAQGYDLQGAAITINVAAGTYANAANISGVIVGGANSGFAATQIKIVGAGATTILDTSTNCAGGATPLNVTNGAIVGIGSMKIQTSCAGGNGVLAINGGTIFLVDSNVIFGPANNAQINIVRSVFDANYGGANCATFAGSATFGFALSTHAIAVTGVGCNNTISGTPAYTCFVSALDHSFYNEGITSAWVNPANATGARYCAAEGAILDREQNAGNLPGSTAGTLQGGSWYYQNNGGTSDIPCIGGTGGCRSATAPTGLGTGGAVFIITGSGDHSGNIQIAIGTAPPASGSVVISPKSILTGDYGGAGFCTVSANNGLNSWPADFRLQSFFDASGLHVRWDGTMLNATYNINYVCN